MAASATATADGAYAQLRKAVKHQLQQLGVTQEVHQMLLEMSQGPGGASVTHETVLQMLETKGLVKQLANSIGPPNKSIAALLQAAQDHAATEQHAIASGPSTRQLLHVKVLAARGFVEYVAREALPEERLVLHGELMGQRFHSAPAAPAAEPNLSAEAYIELPSQEGGGGSGGTAGGVETQAGVMTIPEALHLLTIRQPLHLSVIQQLPWTAQGAGLDRPGAGTGSSSQPAALRRVVVALGAAEWRTVLVRPRSVTISVQLSSGPAGLAAGLPSLPAGMLVLQLSLAPALSRCCLDEPLLASQQRMEGARDAESMAVFLTRARAWWAEFVSLRADFRARPVKVLARGEDGRQYPSCTFLAPLQLGRQLGTPRHAARFVALLRRREDEEAAVAGMGGGEAGAEAGAPGFLAAAAAGVSASGVVDGAVGCWCSLHTVLASGSASREEAALLLCGLLLGFGLDAWVLVGRLRSGVGHCWVLTRGPLAAPCFWEPATGARYTPDDSTSWPYLSVGCAFNHLRMCANCQHDDSAPLTSFLFEDPSLWRSLEVVRAEVPGPSWVPQELAAAAVDCEVEAQLEREIVRTLTQHRIQQLGPSCSTPWDLGLGHMLMPALLAYEHEAVSGDVAPGNEEFQQSIKRAVPLGWLFKGFPLHQRQLGAREASDALLQQPQVLDIMSTRSVGCAFAFRVKLFPYPEGLVSVWMMLAVKYKAGPGHM